MIKTYEEALKKIEEIFEKLVLVEQSANNLYDQGYMSRVKYETIKQEVELNMMILESQKEHCLLHINHVEF